MTEFLTRAFFETELRGLAEAYARESGAAKVQTEIMLRNGLLVRIEGEPVCTDTYIAFDHKQGNNRVRAVLPYGSILGVNFSADQSKTLGFQR